jgi:hypothetical protein
MKEPENKKIKLPPSSPDKFDPRSKDAKINEAYETLDKLFFKVNETIKDKDDKCYWITDPSITNEKFGVKEPTEKLVEDLMDFIGRDKKESKPGPKKPRKTMSDIDKKVKSMGYIFNDKLKDLVKAAGELDDYRDDKIFGKELMDYLAEVILEAVDVTISAGNNDNMELRELKDALKDMTRYVESLQKSTGGRQIYRYNE